MPPQSSQSDPKNSDISTVISLLPVLVDEWKPGLIPGQYTIKPVADPMNDFGLLQIIRAHFPVYLDENRPALIVPAPSDVVAESICKDYKSGLFQVEMGVAEPGLFWAKGAFTKTSAASMLDTEIADARTKQIEWFKRLVSQADDDWGRYRIRRMISTVQRIACNLLKLEREWNLEKQADANLSLTMCKFCRADIRPGGLICPHCQGILDMARYKSEFQKATV